MPSSPFLFLSQPKNIDLLSERLRELGVDVLRVEDSDPAYGPARIILSHASVPHFVMVFHRKWWPDGMHQEDERVCLSADADEVIVCDVSEMLRARFDKPLPHVIVKELTEAVARLIQSAR